MIRPLARLGCSALIATAIGCSWTASPYARDPLVQKKRTVPGVAAMVPSLCSADYPAPPAAPSDEAALLVGK